MDFRLLGHLEVSEGARELPLGGVKQRSVLAILMRAIGRSDGTRSSVLRQIRTGQVEDGLLGDFRFDRGDITPVELPIFRVTGRTPAD